MEKQRDKQAKRLQRKLAGKEQEQTSPDEEGLEPQSQPPAESE